MKSVLISIQPKWCELIANGKKTVEVRKTRPKIETPFKCYVYCTKNRDMLWVLKKSERIYTDKIASIINAKDVGGATKVNGKVIGEFVCDTFITDRTFGHDALFNAAACLSDADAAFYCLNKEMYGWHISDLVIYDKPKELREFCRYDNTYDNAFGYAFEDRSKYVPIKRPPQSWCYVESQ